jgi:haloalkane dehalogenase
MKDGTSPQEGFGGGCIDRDSSHTNTAQPRPSWYPELSFPFESRFVRAGGANLHYIDEGSGPPLLLLHGNPTWSFLYRHLIRELRDEFRCVAPDLPGFGLSSAPTGFDFKPASHAEVIGEFIRALDLRNLTMMVQDWGGPIGLSAAVREPSRFAGFVIGNTFAWSGKGDLHFERFSSIMGGRIAGFLNRQFNFFVRIVIPFGMRRRKPSTEVMQAYIGPFIRRDAREPLRVFPREIIASSDFLEDLGSSLQSIADRPVLIVWGDRDFAFGQKERERFETIFPDHMTVVLPGAGHFIQEDAPEEIARAIRHWWAVKKERLKR